MASAVTLPRALGCASTMASNSSSRKKSAVAAFATPAALAPIASKAAASKSNSNGCSSNSHKPRTGLSGAAMVPGSISTRFILVQLARVASFQSSHDPLIASTATVVQSWTHSLAPSHSLHREAGHHVSNCGHCRSRGPKP